MTIAIIAIGFIYLFIIGIFFIGNMRLTEFEPDAEIPTISFSIVIAFRNEAQQLPGLLESILNLSYPRELFEIIFVDDASEDASVSIISEKMASAKNPIQYQIIPNQKRTQAPKKDAITAAIATAAFDWILTTDADCLIPYKWLIAYNAFILKNNSKLIAGPVDFIADESFLQGYQQLDGWSLQGVTMGGFGLGIPILCNGANLAYRKDDFDTVGGFEGNTHLASGDDIFMLEKLKKKFPAEVGYLKSKQAIVLTHVQTSWKQVFEQRIRWASKTAQQNSYAAKIVAVIVLTTNIAMVVAVIPAFLFEHIRPFYLTFIGLKLLIDYMHLLMVARFFRKKIAFLPFLLSAWVYPIITTGVVLYGRKASYNWKGRSHKM